MPPNYMHSEGEKRHTTPSTYKQLKLNLKHIYNATSAHVPKVAATHSTHTPDDPAASTRSRHDMHGTGAR